MSESSPLPDGIARVGRQPILDRRLRTYGYELLYRPGGDSGWADGNKATASTMLSAFLDLGLKKLTGDHRVFLNMTRTFFTDMPPLPLDRKRVVLEVLEDITIDPAMVTGAKRMQDAGYTLALDDYRFERRWDPLLPYTGIVKVDITDLDLASHADQIELLQRRGLKLLAEKVETSAQYQQTRDLGFDLFQGYFFARPEVVSGRSLDSNAQLLLKLLTRINDPNCSIHELAQLISLDPKLSLKILRGVNCAASGLPREVTSIQEAVVYTGLERLRAWTSLMVMSGLNKQAPELIVTSLVRAELCERLIQRTGEGDRDSAYTVGLLSVLDSLLGQPMASLVSELRLSREIAVALVAHAGTYGKALACALALEKNQWQSPATRLLPAEVLYTLYVDAVARAHAIQQGFN